MPNICLVPNKKALSTGNQRAFSNNEAIMNQNPSHSQMPEFAKNESNTKPVLFQHPTLAEMRPSRRAQFIADLKDLALFIVFAIFAWLLITVLLNAFFGG